MRPDIRCTPRPQWSTDDVTEVGLAELVYEENNQSLQATLLISFLDRTSDFSELYIYIYIYLQCYHHHSLLRSGQNWLNH